MNEPSTLPALADLRRALPELMLHDQHRLTRRIDRASGLRDQAARDKAVTELTAEIERATRRVARRREAVPDISYPAELPVSQGKDDIARAILNTAVEREITLIALGLTGKNVFARLLAGNVPVELIKNTQIPVLLLPPGYNGAV